MIALGVWQRQTDREREKETERRYEKETIH